jgi:hypothetical protein
MPHRRDPAAQLARADPKPPVNAVVRKPEKGKLEGLLHPSAIAGLLVVFFVLGINANEYILRPDQAVLAHSTKWVLLGGVACAAIFYHLTELLLETDHQTTTILEIAPRSEFWLRVASQLALLVSADFLVHGKWRLFIASFGTFFALVVAWDVIMWRHLYGPRSQTSTGLDVVVKDVFALIGAFAICLSVGVGLNAEFASTDDRLTIVVNMNGFVFGGSAVIFVCAFLTVLGAIRKWFSRV